MQCSYDKFEAWLSPRSAGIQVLILKGLQIPVSGTFGPVPSGRLSTMLQKHLKVCCATFPLSVQCSSAIQADIGSKYTFYCLC